MRNDDDNRRFSDEDEWRDWKAAARANDGDRVGGPVSMSAAFAGKDADSTSEMVPCRSCGTPVEISRWALERVLGESFRVYLERRGEPPIDRGEIARCPPCHEAWCEKQRQADLERDAKAVRIQQAVLAGGPLEEFDAAWLRRNGFRLTLVHLERVIRERESDKNQKRGREGL